jgi:hypothetical protein
VQEHPDDSEGADQAVARGGYDGDDDVASCLLRGESGDPEDAYLAILSGNATLDEVDFTGGSITAMRRQRLVPVCFQGVDVADSVDELPGSYRLAKVLAETALEWALTQGRVILTSPLPPIRIRALYTRVGRIGSNRGFGAVACIDIKSPDMAPARR